MQSNAAIGLLGLGLVLLVQNVEGSTPIQKVIEMLGEMKVKGSKEIAVEQMVFKAYTKHVNEQTRDLEYEIKTAKAKIEKLKATAIKAESDAQEAGKEIATIDGQTATLEGDQKAATELRDSEKAKFIADQTDYAESLYAIDRAIQVLMTQNYDRPQAMVLLQGLSSKVRGMRRVLAHLALNDEQAPEGAPEVAAYEFQSGSIVQILKNLKDKFREELATLEKEETNSQHAYDMMMLHSGNTLENLKAEREELSQTKAQAASLAATSKGELADTKADLADAEKFLSEMKPTYEVKSTTYAENQRIRQEELEAIDKAVEILSSSNVSGAYAKHVNAELVQQPARKAQVSFLQVHASSELLAARDRAQKFLATKAKALRSKTLAALAVKIGENPFAKVIEMIETLLEKLKEEAASEADHKAFCDEELKKNKLKRDKLGSQAVTLRAEIEAKAGVIQGLAEDIAALAEEQAERRKGMADATETRTKEKEQNTVAITDSAEAQEAVKQAVFVLKEFYAAQGGEPAASAAAASSFLQALRGQAKGKRQVPEMAAYTGMQGKEGGVIGMLEVIQADFARVEAETRAAETQAAADYAAYMKESEADLEAKHKEEFQKSLDKDQEEFEKEQLEKSLANVESQLSAANLYYDELKPQCVEVHVSYEERSRRRQEEIAALQEAYKILDRKGEAAAVA